MIRIITAAVAVAALLSTSAQAMSPDEWRQYERNLREHPPTFDADKYAREANEGLRQAQQDLYRTAVHHYGERTTLDCLARAGGYFNNSWYFCMLASKAR